MTSYAQSQDETLYPTLKREGDIQYWLRSQAIKKYMLHDDLSVSVSGNVALTYEAMDYIPVKFKEVSSHFHCYGIGLKTLKNTPRFVGGSFNCSQNKLVSLHGAPIQVGENFLAVHNAITSLEGITSMIGGDLNIAHNHLISLKGCPQIIKGNFFAQCNFLSSLKYGPTQVGRDFQINQNKLENLLFGPQKVGGNFLCHGNELITLEGVASHIEGLFDFSSNKIESLRFFPKMVLDRIDAKHNPKLGKAQSCLRYNDIWPYHLEDLIRLEQEELEAKLPKTIQNNPASLYSKEQQSASIKKIRKI